MEINRPHSPTSVPANLLRALNPSRQKLLSVLSAQIDDSMLLEIAEADYGYEAESCLTILRKIRDEGEIPHPLLHVPTEMLELIRWSEPDRPDWKPGSTGKRGHLMRSFCCSVLLAAMGPASDGGSNQTLVQLLASLRELDPPASTAALRFLAYSLLDFPGEREERPFFVLALLLLALRTATPLRGEQIDELVGWLMQEERLARNSEEIIRPDSDSRWLLGLTFFNLRHDVWMACGRELAALAAQIPDHKLRARIEEVAALLASEGTTSASAAEE